MSRRSRASRAAHDRAASKVTTAIRKREDKKIRPAKSQKKAPKRSEPKSGLGTVTTADLPGGNG